jgi:murein tripeptide amidase MpaA
MCPGAVGEIPIIDINSDFEGGSIVSLGRLGDDVHLALRPDTGACRGQWFNFRFTDESATLRKFCIENADEAYFPRGWDECEIVSSPDGAHWQRVKTVFDGKRLWFHSRGSQQGVQFALFVPYTSHERNALIQYAEIRQSARQIELIEVGRSNLGNDIRAIRLGAGNGPKVWVIARQHPGESMSEWAAEGMTIRLLAGRDSRSRRLSRELDVTIVPVANPDGVMLGNMRCNAAGRDLNRTWYDPQPDSPEVVGLLRSMERTGVDLFLDLHGDEVSPEAYFASPTSLTIENRHQAHLEDVLLRSFIPNRWVASPEAGPGEWDGLAMDVVAAQFGCPALTIEIPFKTQPEEHGEGGLPSPRWCVRFGSRLVDLLADYFAGS